MRLVPELKSKIDTLWDRFWSGGMSNPLQSIEQMSYLIFMKRLEDMDLQEGNRARANNIPFTSVFSGHEKCRWSVWKHCPAEKMLPHVRDKVFPFIQNLHNGEKSLFAQQMKDAVFIIPKYCNRRALYTIVRYPIRIDDSSTPGDVDALVTRLEPCEE